jgi:hypothetical protein
LKLQNKHAIAFGFALAIVLTLSFVLREGKPTAHVADAPAKALTAQILHVSNSDGVEFAQLHLGIDGSIFLDLEDAEHLPLLGYSTTENDEQVTLYSRIPGVYLTAIMEPEPVFHLQMPGGKFVQADAQQGWKSTTSSALAKYAYQKLFERPEHTIIDTIPSEDLRLLDHQGRLFCILGLTEAGEPSMVLVRPNGELLVELFVTRPTFSNMPMQWPTIVIFDRHGAARIQIDLGPRPAPVVTIFEKCSVDKASLEVCRFDPNTGKEVPKVHLLDEEEGALPWLSHDMPKITLPMILLDQRGQSLWKSASLK